jgi:hypothetical protein
MKQQAYKVLTGVLAVALLVSLVYAYNAHKSRNEYLELYVTLQLKALYEDLTLSQSILQFILYTVENNYTSQLECIGIASGYAAATTSPLPILAKTSIQICYTS